MTELSRVILDRFQIRKTKKQKSEFIAFLQKELPELRVEEGGGKKSRNLVLGDVKKARIVCGAHYDTCPALPFPNFITPKNFPVTLLYSLLICIPFFAVMIGVELLLSLWIESSLLLTWISLLVFLFTYQTVLLHGPANKHTVNDNTSGVITLIELIALCRERGIHDVAFVFFDHEETGLQGSAFFRKKHKADMKDKLLVNFDCVSDGDHMLFVLNKKARLQYEEALKNALPADGEKTAHVEKSSTTFYPSDQMGFPVAMAVSAMKKKLFIGLYLDRIHTGRDTVMDERNITYLLETMERFLAVQNRDAANIS